MLKSLLIKVGDAPDNDWDSVVVFFFLEIFCDATLSLSGLRYVK